MRFTKLAVVAALAVALNPAGAAAQERAPAGTVLSAPIDHRLLVSDAQQRATLAGARQRAELRADDWNLYGLMEYMASGIVPGFVIGSVVGGVTSDGGLDAMAGVLAGGIFGIGIGMGVGGIVYTVQRL